MINPVSLLARLFAAKGNEIQTEMKNFVDAGVVEPIAVGGFAAPFKYIGNSTLENQASYDLTQDVQVPILGAGDTYEVLMFSSGNFIERTWGVSSSEYLVFESKILTSATPYGMYAIVDVLDDSFSGQLISYRISG